MKKQLIMPVVIAALTLSACSDESSTPSVDNSKNEQKTPKATVSESAQEVPIVLTEREALRGEIVLIPDSWEMLGEDGGGSGSTSDWVDPQNPSNWISVWDGVEIGSWFEVDGVSGSIDPSMMLPDSAEITRLDRTVFRFSYDAKVEGIEGSSKVLGIWMVDLRGMSYACLEVSLPPENSGNAEEIISQFEVSTTERFESW